MGKIDITLTGADEHTSIVDLIKLSRLGAEIGLLLKFSPEGRHRYPGFVWINNRASCVPCAIHICGSLARAELHNGGLTPLLDCVQRFQINGSVTKKELLTVCERYPGKTVITQNNAANASLAKLDIPNHAILVDASGGRGKSPASWERPDTKKPVGFAGGLGPDNLLEELPKIAAIADPKSWIDMEGKLRDEYDYFSVSKAIDVMTIWKGFTK